MDRLATTDEAMPSFEAHRALFETLFAACVTLEGLLTQYLELLVTERDALLSFDTGRIEALTQSKIALLTELHEGARAPSRALQDVLLHGAIRSEADDLPAALGDVASLETPMSEDFQGLSERLFALDTHVRKQHMENQELTRRSLGWIHTCLGAIDGDAVGYDKYGARRGSVLSTMRMKV